MLMRYCSPTLLIGLVALPLHGAAAMAPDGRMEREGSIILTPSAFDGRMRRRRRRRAIGSAPPTSSVGYFRGGGAASSAEVDRRRNDKTTATAPPAPNDDDDALPILMRVALGAVVQTCLSYAIASNLFALGNLTRASALLFVVYGSSYLGFIVEMMGSKSAAIRQVLDPGRVPVSHELSGGDILVFFFSAIRDCVRVAMYTHRDIESYAFLSNPISHLSGPPFSRVMIFDLVYRQRTMEIGMRA